MNRQIICPVDWIRSRAPDSLAVVYGSQKITYKELHDRIILRQQTCQVQGIQKGTKAAIQSQNSLEYIILLFALWRIGAVACLLSPRTPAKTTEQQLKQLNCQICVCPNKKIKNKLRNLNIKHRRNPFTFSPEALSTIMLTSGSVGQAKAVALSNRNHYFNAIGANKNIPVNRGDCWLLSLPLYHVSGLAILWRVFLGGGTIALADDTQSFCRSIKKYQITHLSLVATQLLRALKSPEEIRALQKLKALLLGGGPIPDELIKTSPKLNLPVFLTYGLTEMASQVATSQKSKSEKIKILKHRQIKISADNEILVKGKTLFKGYLRNKKIIPVVDLDGWFHTGDLGTYNSKEGLKILGRKDNMFISGGENIYPEEIEKALLDTNLIEQAVVLPAKNTEFGFRPVAFVKWHKNKKIPLSKIQSTLAKTLPAFKIPIQIRTIQARYLKQGIKINRQALKSSLNF